MIRNYLVTGPDLFLLHIFERILPTEQLMSMLIKYPFQIRKAFYDRIIHFFAFYDLFNMSYFDCQSKYSLNYNGPKVLNSPQKIYKR